MTPQKVMKKCQVGTRNYQEANDLHAECYGTIGNLAGRLEEIREIYAGMEGFIPKTAPEAYQEKIIKDMYKCAIEGIK